MRRILLISSLLVFYSMFSFAQERTVTGTVTSANEDEPIPGVNVIVKGTDRGTVTDIDGNYSVSASSNDALNFSYIGYESIEVPVGSRSVIDVSLQEDVQQLEEIVVTGYGSQVRRDVTGAISTVKGEDLAEVPVASFDQALQGRAAGVQVSQGSGVPGSGVRIQVRGTSSISAGTEPLYVVDGFPVTMETRAGVNPLAMINPNDIESIEVLKDAQAAAIYGSRGANGVILITTKKGEKGQGEFSVSYRRGVTTPTNMVDLVNARQWLDLTDLAFANDGFQNQWDPVEQQVLLSDQALGNPDHPSHFTRDRIDNFVNSNPEGTDWLDPFWSDGSIEEVNLSFSQGFEGGQVYASGQYRNEQGLVKGLDFKRYVARINSSFTPANNLTAGVNLNLSYLDNDRIPLSGGGGQRNGGRNDRGRTPNYGVATTAAPPIFPYYVDSEQEVLFDPLGRLNTLLTTMDIYENVTNTYRGIGNAFLDYKIIEGLSFRVEGSVDFQQSRQREWAGDVIRPSPYSRETNSVYWNRNIAGYFTYKNTFGEHNLNLTLGAEQQQRRLDYQASLGAENLTSANQAIGEINNFGDDVLVMVVGEYPDVKIRSFFARANYKFKDRYLFGASFRRDGASVFGENNRYGIFPAVSAGWIISEEDFMTWDPLNYLKFRVSYGQTGNANLPANVQDDSYTSWPAYGSGGGINLSGLGNPSIGWENIISTDVGVEAGFFQNRITASANYYNQDVNDMLLRVPIPSSQGILFGSSDIWDNIGKLRNSGFEFQISTVNVDNTRFSWSTDFNITSLNNQIISLAENLTENRLGITNGRTVTRTDESLAAYFIADYAGVDPTTGYDMIWEIDRDLFLETGETVKTGRKIIATQQNVNDNRFIHKDKTSLPTYFGGITNNFTYGDFTLSFQFTFQGGNYIYDALEIEHTTPDPTGTIRTDYLGNYWTPDNRNAIYPRPSYQNVTRDGVSLSRNHSRYLYRGDFGRLQFAQIAYNVPQEWISNAGLTAARVFVSGSNLLTFTGYDGYDPETVNFDGDEQSRNLSQGFISGAQYPQVITITGGVRLTF